MSKEFEVFSHTDSPATVAEVTIEKDSVMLEAISELEIPFQKILSEIHGRIDKGEYKYIIGDDASGRVPTLIMSKVINGIYKDTGERKVKTYFIEGFKSLFQHTQSDRTNRKNEILEHFKHIKLGTEIEETKKQSIMRKVLKKFGIQEKSRNRVLIVTNTIFTGDTIQPLAGALKELGLEYDIASVSITESDKHDKFDAQDKLDAFIYHGMEEEPLIYDDHNLAGVERDGSALLARGVRPFIRAEDTTDTQKIGASEGREAQTDEERALTVKAREDIKTLSDKLINFYHANI